MITVLCLFSLMLSFDIVHLVDNGLDNMVRITTTALTTLLSVCVQGTTKLSGLLRSSCNLLGPHGFKLSIFGDL